MSDLVSGFLVPQHVRTAEQYRIRHAFGHSVIRFVPLETTHSARRKPKTKSDPLFVFYDVRSPRDADGQIAVPCAVSTRPSMSLTLFGNSHWTLRWRQPTRAGGSGLAASVKGTDARKQDRLRRVGGGDRRARRTTGIRQNENRVAVGKGAVPGKSRPINRPGVRLCRAARLGHGDQAWLTAISGVHDPRRRYARSGGVFTISSFRRSQYNFLPT